MKKGTIAVLSTLGGLIIGCIGQGILNDKKIAEKKEKVDKFKNYYNMLNHWLALKQEGKSLETYFVENNIKTLAIYGVGEMGNRIYDELKDSEIVVKYGIDKSGGGTFADLEIFTLEEDLEEVDAIIVTAVFAFDEIEELVSKKVTCPIISLEDIVYKV